MSEQEYRTEIQNYLIANAESDIRIVKHKIDGMKEEYRQFDDEADFAERLEKLYTELGNHEHRLAMIKMHPYNSTSWEVSEINSDPNFAVGYDEDVFCPKSDYPPIEYRDSKLDRLNIDL